MQSLIRNKILVATLISTTAFCTFVIQGCKKNVDQVIEEVIEEYVLGGAYKAVNGLEVEIKGDEALVTDIGNSDLQHSAGQFNVGDPYIRKIVKLETNKYEGEVVVTKVHFDPYVFDYVMTDLHYEKVQITTKEDGFNLDNSNAVFNGTSFTKTTGNAGNGNGEGDCIEGTWYSSACGDPKGVIWTFNKGKGSFSNKDCNGICTPMVFTFSYTISGNTCTIDYDAVQPIVKCTGYQDSRPNSPKDAPFTFSCTGTTLTVTSGSGTNTFTK